MARKYLGYTKRGLRTRYGIHLTPDHWPLLFLEEGEVESVELDFTDYLDSGETVSSATVSTEGSLTAGSPAVASPKVTIQFSEAKAWGRATVTVTMSSGAKVIEKIEVRERHRRAAPIPTDYPSA